MTARDAVDLIPSQCTLLTEGFVGACFAEELAMALEQRFLETKLPRNLTLVYAAGQGDAGDRGLNHLGHAGLLRRVIGGHWNLVPKIQALAMAEEIEAYNLPQGVITHLTRDIAAGKPGTLTSVGLGTFVDPRQEGGRLNRRTKKDIVEVLETGGREFLFYHPFSVDVALLRGTYGDELGNVSMEKEGLTASMLAAAQAAKNSGGLVLVQVEKIVAANSLAPRSVQIPGILVDVLVPVAVKENHMQTYRTGYNPAFSGEIRAPLQSLPQLAPGVRRIIAQRALKELTPGAVVNLGIGMPEGIAALANEAGRNDFTLTVEAGPIGGIPQGGLDFGCAVNPQAIIDMASQFDFYQGGGLDIAFLGMAQVDRDGNVNVSKFSGKIPGCGGFIDISQNARKVVFCGSFTANGLEAKTTAKGVNIIREGSIRKFVPRVEQITFNGKLAAERGQDVLYITERAVFRLTKAGLKLEEVYPGIDHKRDILAQLPPGTFLTG